VIESRNVYLYSICMYINAVANSVVLCLQRDFYNITFKIKPELYIASGSAPQGKILGAHLGWALPTTISFREKNFPFFQNVRTGCGSIRAACSIVNCVIL
jgi:hypothetical protein